jgi:deoxyribodipyrimidine photo-lyase
LAQGVGAQLGRGQILLGALPACLAARDAACAENALRPADVTAAASTHMTVAIHWFRNDLRLHDNPALRAAASADRLLCVYIHDPRHDLPTRWGFPRMGGHRRRFLADGLGALAAALAMQGQRLQVIVGSAPEVLPELAARAGAAVVHCEWIAAPEEEADVAALRASGLQVDCHWQSSLLEPTALPFAVDGVPLVFSDFRRRVESAGVRPREPLPPPEELPPPPAAAAGHGAPAVAAIEQWLAAPPAADDPRSAFPYAQPAFRAGEGAALAHLQRYFDSDLPQRYKRTRNGLQGVDYSTKFSPWLASGALSARRVHAALRAHEMRCGSNEDTYWINFELLWRDHFRLLHLRFGSRLYGAAGLSRFPPPGHDSAAFARWCAGRCGEPFIDAGMRELAASGYLSNRMRQNVASWLVNDLHCDHRAGAAWFESQLIDYDPCSNQGNWLYLAGRGTDPRAGRRFDPGKQARDYDPQGSYRDLWNAGH